MIADAIGWKLDKTVVGEVEPATTKSTTKRGYREISPGRVTGVMQRAEEFMGGRSVIELNFSAYVGSEEEYDMAEIDGIPPYQLQYKSMHARGPRNCCYACKHDS